MDIAQTIKQRAAERGVDPELALAIAKAESGLRPQIKNPKSSAHGLFQIVDDTWKQYGGDPKKRKDVNENIRVGLEIIADNQRDLQKTFGREPRRAEVYAAHFFGKEGAKKVIGANPDALVSTVVSEKVLKSNPELLQGKTVFQALDALGRKVGDTGPGQPIRRVANAKTPVYREDPAKPPVIFNAVDATRQYGAGYQAALALSYLSDTQEESDDPDAPSIVERDAREEMAEQRAQIAAAAAAPSGSSAASMLAKMDFGYAPVVGQPKAPVKMAEGGLLSRAAEAGVGIRPSYAKRLSTSEGWGSQAEYDAFADRAKKDAADRSAAVQQAAAMGFFNEGGEVSDPEAALFAGRNDVPAKPKMTNKEFLQQVLYGVGDLPYVVAGAPVDLASLVMMPFGYKDDKPFMGSADIKARMTRAGIRPADTEEERLKGPRTAAELLVSLINPAGATRSAVLAAGKGARGAGEAARMLEDATVGNIQRGRVRRAGEQVPPDTAYAPLRERMEAQGSLAYALRDKGTPVVISPKSPATTDDFLLSMSRAELKAFQEKNPDVAIYSDREMAATPEFQAFAAKANAPVDAAEAFVKREVATTDDSTLNNWFMKAFTRYLRSDFASPQDQLVRAAEEGKLLHLAPKKFSEFSEVDQRTKNYLKVKDSDIQHARRTEGFRPEGEAKDSYAKTIESLTDNAAYPEQIGDLSPSSVPPSLRGRIETNPETRAMAFAPDIGGILKIPELRDKMLKIRALGPKAEYSAYGQAPAKVPSEFLLPDDTLEKLNVAAVSNRVARFTRWQEETRQGMATTALRSDPKFKRQPLQDGKYVGVALPDVDVYPKYMPLVNDVGCDGGWCTQNEAIAMTYGSGDARLHVVVTGGGNKARPVAQLSVEKSLAENGVPRYSITEIKERGDTNDFLNNPALPAIQEYVQDLDRTYGGLAYVSDLEKLDMKQLPKNPMGLLTLFDGFRARSQLAKAFGSEQQGFAEVRDELIRLNNGSQYTTGNEDDVADLINRAVSNVLNPRQRAAGGMVERNNHDNRLYK